MLSFLKKVISSVIPGESSVPLDEENEEDIMACVMHFNTEILPLKENEVQREQPLGENDVLQHDIETFKCVQKTGKVTHLCDDYGLIDNVICFKPSQVAAGINLKLNDEVLYSAYKAKENEMDRVFKVYGVKNNTWDSYDVPEAESAETAKEISALKRVVTGRVTEKRGREVYVESANIWCNLDNIQSSYVPVEGDWVELQAVVSISPDSTDLSGEILIVKSLKPLLMKSGFGRITLWSETQKEGAIENSIYFTVVACEDWYFPELGDEVVYDAVESDQDRFRWRATKVIFNSKKLTSKSIANSNLNRSVNSASDIFSDKNDISIIPTACAVEIQLNQKKIVMVEVTNNGTVEQLIKYTKFHHKHNSQVTLLKPTTNNNIINPKKTLTYHFQVEGKNLGITVDIFYFYFNSFVIAKRFEINVVSSMEMNKFMKCDFNTVFKYYKGNKLKKKEVNADLVLYGPRLWKPPKFVSQEQRCIYNIPKKLWSLVLEKQQWTSHVTEYAPYLKEDLIFKHYAERFHTLLYLEEIQMKLQLRKYDMNGVFLRRNDDYFVLDVPNLVEKRSLFFGLRVIVTQPWSKGPQIKHIGYIYYVRAGEIYVKFHSSFHDSYDETECDVTFETVAPFFSRSHEAVTRAVKTLGEPLLFPSAVNEKQPLINLDLSEEKTVILKNVNNFSKEVPKHQVNEKLSIRAPEASEVDFLQNTNVYKETSPKKKLIWNNKHLNERQKLAIVNVLEGKGRPLPYIIFGPPGTGKTVTLVELIIQIYTLMPDSRILVATPSNSAADLICERLIERGNFRPGQLVRPVALHRVIEGLIPPKLIPYSTILCPKGQCEQNQFKMYCKNNIKISLLSEFSGRHRITIGTCVTIGVLHYAGLAPGHFTHILIDEAAQTSEPEALISATFQNTQNGLIVLAGDPQQLGPVIFSHVARKFGLGESLLLRLVSVFPYAKDFDSFPKTSGFDPRFITKLTYNYRSVPEILALPNQMFYNSDLIPTVSENGSAEAEIIKKFNFKAENRETPAALIFHGIVGQNLQEIDSPSWFNPHEVWQVVFYVRKCYSLGLKNDDIGIITPYSKQVKKLKSLMVSLNLSTPKIGSVEEFQGQERLVIILSTVRSSPKHVSTDILNCLGFVANPQRLNVALTRARALLIIVGNPFLLSKDPYWTNLVYNYGRALDSKRECDFQGGGKTVVAGLRKR